MRKIVVKITVAVILISLTTLSFILVDFYKKNKHKSDATEYNVEIVLIDISNEMIADDTYLVPSNYTLFKILNENYNLVYDETVYGVRVLCIDSMKTNFKDEYIAIYVDDKYSDAGVSKIYLYDGIKVTFKETSL